MIFVYCSRECNVFGASYINCGCWNSSPGFCALGIWIHEHDIRICPHLWFSQMLGALQCRSSSSCLVQGPSLPQIPHLHANVSPPGPSFIMFDFFFPSIETLSTIKSTLIIHTYIQPSTVNSERNSSRYYWITCLYDGALISAPIRNIGFYKGGSHLKTPTVSPMSGQVPPLHLPVYGVN